MKQNLDDELAKHEAQLNNDLEVARDKACAVYEKLSTRAVSRYERRVDKSVERHRKLSAMGASANAGDGSSLRELIRKKVGTLCSQVGFEYRAIYTEIYARIFEATGYNPASDRKNGETVLDVVESTGLLGLMDKIVSAMMNDPSIYEGRPGLSRCPIEEQLPLPLQV